MTFLVKNFGRTQLNFSKFLRCVENFAWRSQDRLFPFVSQLGIPILTNIGSLPTPEQNWLKSEFLLENIAESYTKTVHSISIWRWNRVSLTWKIQMHAICDGWRMIVSIKLSLDVTEFQPHLLNRSFSESQVKNRIIYWGIYCVDNDSHLKNTFPMNQNDFIGILKWRADEHDFFYLRTNINKTYKIIFWLKCITCNFLFCSQNLRRSLLRYGWPIFKSWNCVFT